MKIPTSVRPPIVLLILILLFSLGALAQSPTPAPAAQPAAARSDGTGKLDCRGIVNSQGEDLGLECRRASDKPINTERYQPATATQRTRFCEEKISAELHIYERVGRYPTNMKVEGCAGFPIKPYDLLNRRDE
jgi:hypothetical protein